MRSWHLSHVQARLAYGVAHNANPSSILALLPPATLLVVRLELLLPKFKCCHNGRLVGLRRPVECF